MGTEPKDRAIINYLTMVCMDIYQQIEQLEKNDVMPQELKQKLIAKLEKKQAHTVMQMALKLGIIKGSNN